MRELVMSLDIYKTLLALLDGYKDKDMPPTDYLRLHEGKFPTQTGECDSCIEIFLLINQQKPLLEDITNYFYCLGKRRDHSDQNSLMILCHILICLLNESNKDIVFKILEEEGSTKIIHLLQMFTKKFIVEDIFIAGCKYFENGYIENITSKMKENKSLHLELLERMKQSTVEKKAKSWKPPTRPVSPKFSHISRKPPPPPNNTPNVFKLPPPNPVPLSTYQSPRDAEVLSFLKKLHLEETSELLETAQKSVEKLTVARVKHSCPAVNKNRPRPRQRIALKSDVSVKKNAATVLREASRVIKDEEKEIKKVNALLSGAANYTRYEEWLEQVRITEERNKLDDIERKHLQGLLSREEAILARQALLNANKEKRALFEKERKETEEILKKMREQNNEKLKEIIETTQNIQKNINEKKKTLISQKHKKAQEVADTSRQLYERAVYKKKEELEKKIEIIKEIRALTTIKAWQTEKFDPTETTNLGLMCEMSLAELQERLQINKVTMKEELKRRQDCIRMQRQKQQEFLVETEQFIEFCRQQKKILNCKPEGEENEKINISKTKIESPDIAELREKLKNARSKRMDMKN